MANEPIITITGNLTAAPELKYVGDGTPVSEFTVASTPRVKQGDQWTDGEPMFVRCTVWREYAENVTESLDKGMRVLVTGRLTTRKFQRKDGSEGMSLELQVDEVGPSLRYATTQVARTAPHSSQGSQGYGRGVFASQRGAREASRGNDPAGNLAGIMTNDTPPF